MKLAFCLVAACLLAGCHRKSAPTYAERSTPVIDAFEKLRSDCRARVGIETYRADLATADNAVRVWKQSLAPAELSQPSAKEIEGLLRDFRVRGVFMEQRADLADVDKENAQRLDKAEQLLKQGS